MADRVLLIGGAGSLGRAMVERWPSDLEPPIIWDVVVADRDGATALDLTDAAAVQDAVADLPDTVHVVHLAARLSVSAEPDIVRESILNNVASLVVPATVLDKRIGTLTLVSSVSVYDATTPSPLPECALPGPRTSYGAGKAAAEVIGSALARMGGWRFCAIRPTQLFGLPSAQQSLPHVLVDRGKAGEELTLSADPATLRDYLHVDDATALLLEQCRSPREGIFNLGSGSPVSLGALFDAAASRWGVPVRHSSAVATRADQFLDITHTCEEFNFNPRNSVLDWIKTSG